MYQEKQEENELRALPPASAAHLRALDASIQRTARQNGISQEDLEVRKAVVTRMEEIVRRHLPGWLACSASKPNIKEIVVIITLAPSEAGFSQKMLFSV